MTEQRPIPFDNSYAALPEGFFTRMPPTPVRQPGLVAVNDALARDLGIDPAWLRGPEGLAMLAGNALPEGAAPLAQVYAGHQFGGWSPRLGDGRAILLGEVLDRNGTRRDIQLKGAGRTPYSRGGDGRAWIGPVLREYLLSEAMHAMGVPSTRALAAVTTGEDVYRETRLPGAVLTRVAASHIRVGTFQYFAAQGDTAALRALADHAIARHYPDAGDTLGLFAAVMAAQARLVAQWMGLGFIHGVMNTDNCAISGETIDYGPCAFMDRYHPHTVFSSIDQFGRYAYDKQADIAGWNLAQLASALVPLIDADPQVAVDRASAALHRFPDLFRDAWLEVFRAKLGLATAHEDDPALIHQLLDLMARLGADFTNTFRGLSDDPARIGFSDAGALDAWLTAWHARLAREGTTLTDAQAAMRRVNPAVIPRNHRVEEVIASALGGDYDPFRRFLAIVTEPFEIALSNAEFQNPPRPGQEVRQTFCGT